jgi:hypothetical protein
MAMTQKIKHIAMWIGGSIVGGGLALTVIGMATQFWIATEVKTQLVTGMTHVHPATTQLTTDVEVIRTSVTNIDGKIDTALESQQRFEELFIEYLQRQAESN